jgi:hypothetical protein
MPAETERQKQKSPLSSWGKPSITHAVMSRPKWKTSVKLEDLRERRRKVMKSEADDNIFVAKHFFCGYGLGAGSPNPSNLRGLHFAVLCLRMMSLKNLTLPDLMNPLIFRW